MTFRIRLSFAYVVLGADRAPARSARITRCCLMARAAAPAGQDICSAIQPHARIAMRCLRIFIGRRCALQIIAVFTGSPGAAVAGNVKISRIARKVAGQLI